MILRLAIALMFVSHTLPAQIIALDTNQTLLDFVENQFSTAPLKFDSVRTFQIGNQSVQAATAYHFNPDHDDNLLIYIYRELDQNRFQQIFVDSQGVNGGLAELVTMFSANADTDDALEVVVLYKWRVKNYDFEGYIYEVYCYDDAALNGSSLKPIEDQPKISCGLEGWRLGKIEHAKYNTEAKIRRRLKQLGFRQNSKQH